MIIKAKFDKAEQKVLKALGADPIIFGHTNPIDLEKSLIEFKPNIDYIVCKVKSVQDQEKSLVGWLENPLDQKGLLVVNSYPSDIRAKVVAANIMLSAMAAHRESDANIRSKYDSPEWHRLYGGYASKFRDNRVTKPRMLVLSNIIETSTGQKLEKLRDILDKYSDVPTVLAISTKTDPISFISKTLHLPIKSAVYIGSDRMVVRSLLDT